MNGSGRNSSLSLLTLSGERRTARIPFLSWRSFLLYNNYMSIVEDIYPVRKNIDDQIDEWDEIGID